MRKLLPVQVLASTPLPQRMKTDHLKKRTGRSNPEATGCKTAAHLARCAAVDSIDNRAGNV
jgi:hypothetical protein